VSVQLTITKCQECPHHAMERYYTADSFEHVSTLLCKKTDRPHPEATDMQETVPNSSRVALIDSGAKQPAVPDWCPLRNEADGNAVNQCKCGACDSCCPDDELWK
jgi:hypothetical protein